MFRVIILILEFPTNRLIILRPPGERIWVLGIPERIFVRPVGIFGVPTRVEKEVHVWPIGAALTQCAEDLPPPDVLTVFDQ